MTSHNEAQKTKRDEVKELLDHPRSGLKESSNTNKIRMEILGIVSELESATKADWLRSEIEKLEGMRVGDRPTDFHGDNDPQWWDECAKGYNIALDSIITRYKEELKVLESK